MTSRVSAIVFAMLAPDGVLPDLRRDASACKAYLFPVIFVKSGAWR
jgi:hypothetical protein